MHIIMGIGNVVFNELKRVSIELDESEEIFSSNHSDIEKEIKNLYERKENITTIHANYSLDSMIILNDMRRLQCLKEGKEIEAANIAKENYDEKTKKTKLRKKSCNANVCIIYPCDEINGFADTIECTGCGYTLHIRCEGIVLLDGEELPSSYDCKKCLGFGINSVWLQGTFKSGKLLLEDKIHAINTELRNINMQIENLEEVESKCGVRLAKLKEACKSLKLDPAKYHGGDFEGKESLSIPNG